MEPTITRLPAMHLTGLKKNICVARDETIALWQAFAPQIKNIPNRANQNRINLTNYLHPIQETFLNLALPFERWAAVEVTGFSEVLTGLETLTIPEGLYAVFIHKGTALEFSKTLEYIYMQWMPAAGYQPDNRPHFETMGPDYKYGDPEASETVYIPVKQVS